MAIPLEDNAADVIGKAQRGLAISDSELAEKARISSEQIRRLRAGEFDEMAMWRIAPDLDLAARALVELAQGNYQPEIEEVAGLAQFNTPYGDMTVNAYLVWDPKTRSAAVFDTGADCTPILQRIEAEKLQVGSIFLTHAHPDHVADLERLKKETGAPVYAPEKETVAGATSVTEGQDFAVGKLEVETRLTSGHSPGGITYVVNGLKRPVAIVGDSMFAGSMGGGSVSYEDALRNNLEKILTLPDETIICPGHGPMTTVGNEKEHNPFFAHKFSEV